MLHDRIHRFLMEGTLSSKVVSKTSRQLPISEFFPWESRDFYCVTWMLVAHNLLKKMFSFESNENADFF